MTPERWQVVRELFEEAMSLPKDQRRQLVTERCGEDRELLRETVALLESDERAGSFMADLVAAAPEDSPGADREGSREDGREDGRKHHQEGTRTVGSYRLLRKLGEGGMGSVYVAIKDDRSVERHVVVKLIRSGMESAQTRRRLSAERRILASLEHPNIARLYDSGTTHHESTVHGEAQPYFVMELVEGQPIDEYCDRHRLPVTGRLELFCKVCSAVHYAHQHLIVHRDLKPSNILVTAAGEPKLLDFGIAKHLDAKAAGIDSASTVPWGRWLTPDYASPEQILGRGVTTASDVYSLGVLLCKLLVGVLPRSFRSVAAAEIERAFLEDAPTRPSVLLGRLPPQVPAQQTATQQTSVQQTVAQQTVAQQTQRGVSEARRVRPQQLRQKLSGDLDTIVLKALHTEPGRRYASAEQLSEDLSRHLRGFPVEARPDSTLYRLGKYVRRHRLGVAAALAFVVLLAGSSLALAVQSAEVTRERDQLRAVLTFVKETFKVAAEGEELTVRQAVDRSAAILERQLREQPDVRATLMDTTGTIYLNLWAVDQARALLEQAVEIRSRLHGDSDPSVAESLSSLGLALAFQGDFEAGENKAREALAMSRREYGERHPELVQPLNNLVSLLCYKSDFAAAEAPSTEALELARQLPEDREWVAAAIGNRALVLTKTDRDAAATELYREALALHRRQTGEEHPAVAAMLGSLALVLKRQGKLDQAEDHYRQALALERRVFGEDNSRLSVTLNNLGALLLARQDPAAAAVAFGDARDQVVRSLGQRHPAVLITSVGLASALIAKGEPAAAEKLLGGDLESWREQLGESWLVANCESVLGESLAAQGRYREAERLLVASYPKIRQAQGDHSSKTRDAHQRLVALYRAWDRPDQLADVLANAPDSAASDPTSAGR